MCAQNMSCCIPRSCSGRISSPLPLQVHIILPKDDNTYWKALFEGSEEKSYYELLKEAVNSGKWHAAPPPSCPHPHPHPLAPQAHPTLIHLDAPTTTTLTHRQQCAQRHCTGSCRTAPSCFRRHGQQLGRAVCGIACSRRSHQGPGVQSPVGNSWCWKLGRLSQQRSEATGGLTYTAAALPLNRRPRLSLSPPPGGPSRRLLPLPQGLRRPLKACAAPQDLCCRLAAAALQTRPPFPMTKWMTAPRSCLAACWSGRR